MMGTAMTTILITVHTTNHSVGPSSPAPKSLIAEIISISGWLHRYISIAAAQGGRLRKRTHNTNGAGGHGLIKLELELRLTFRSPTLDPSIVRHADGRA